MSATASATSIEGASAVQLPFMGARKAISLWQPWASAIAVGAKRVETRSWATSYRGPIAIHAAKRMVVDELIRFQCCWNWCGALRSLGLQMGGKHSLRSLLPFGAIVAVADLVDCRPTGSFTGEEIDLIRLPEVEEHSIYGWTERMMGDFSLGRFGWILKNVRQIEPAFPLAGRQGIFNLPESL